MAAKQVLRLRPVGQTTAWMPPSCRVSWICTRPSSGGSSRISTLSSEARPIATATCPATACGCTTCACACACDLHLRLRRRLGARRPLPRIRRQMPRRRRGVPDRQALHAVATRRRRRRSGGPGRRLARRSLRRPRLARRRLGHRRRRRALRRSPSAAPTRPRAWRRRRAAPRRPGRERRSPWQRPSAPLPPRIPSGGVGAAASGAGAPVAAASGGGGGKRQGNRRLRRRRPPPRRATSPSGSRRGGNASPQAPWSRREPAERHRDRARRRLSRPARSASLLRRRLLENGIEVPPARPLGLGGAGRLARRRGRTRSGQGRVGSDHRLSSDEGRLAAFIGRKALRFLYRPPA